jgi:selenide, water dikinase
MHRLPSRDIVLVGAGHTNLYIVKQWADSPVTDSRLTLISASASATYSGMLPGTLAGLYQPEEMLIDLHRLSQATGTRLVVDKVVGVDPERQTIHFDERPNIRFDMASIGIGSIPAGLSTVSQHPGLVAVKPMFSFLDRLEAVLNGVTNRPVDIVVAGGGAAGVEITFCLRQLMRRRGTEARLRLVDGGSHILPGFRERTVEIVEREFARREIELLTSRRISGCTNTTIEFTDGSSTSCDVLLWCVGAAPPTLLSHTSLPLSNRGFIKVHDTLMSVSGQPIFAVGDSAEFAEDPVPRAGVYAVRQGPILFENLHRLAGHRSLLSYHPQRDFLRLLATGDGNAVGQYGRLAGSGKWLWKLKNRIDTRFMNMFRPESNPMLQMNTAMNGPEISKTTEEPEHSAVMRCNGCGGKTSPRVLQDVLRELRADSVGVDSEGFLQFGDSAILSGELGPADAVSVDFFQSFMDDPWIVGRVAAIHALSDLWAAGTKPTAAVAMVTLPEGSRRQQRQMLAHLLRGAIREFETAGVVLVGGHTVDGESLSIGFTVMGQTQDQRPFSKYGLQPGDQLILTKPVGTGVILAAAAVNKATTIGVQAAVDCMLQSNRLAADVARSSDLTSVTDVTGFGLAGHLFEMLDASNVSARLDLSALPLLPGASQCFSEGVRSSLDPENRHIESRIVTSSAQLCTTPEYDVLFDPQTSGGLLLSVSSDMANDTLQRLVDAGMVEAHIIGEVIDAKGQDGKLQLRP